MITDLLASCSYMVVLSTYKTSVFWCNILYGDFIDERFDDSPK
jgi:hypothetical protein